MVLNIAEIGLFIMFLLESGYVEMGHYLKFKKGSEYVQINIIKNICLVNTLGLEDRTDEIRLSYLKFKGGFTFEEMFKWAE
jgi:hypothetical protein